MSPSEESAARDAAAAWGRIGRAIRILIGGRALFALVNLAAVAVATRAVGLEALGAVGLLLAASRLIGDALKFSSWQALLVFGSGPLAAGDRATLGRLAALTLALDAAAISASFLLLLALAAFAGPALGWTEAMIEAAPWFGLLMIFVTHMTPTGLLRLEGRVFALASQHALTALLRLAGALLLLRTGGGFEALAAVWVGAGVIAGFALWLAGARAGRRMMGAPRFAAAWREGARGFPGFLRFAFAANLVSTLNAAAFPVATLIVGAAFGPAEAGLFHLVRQIAEAMLRPGEAFTQAIFPELSALAATGARGAMRAVLLRALLWSALLPGAVAALLYFFGGDLLALLFGAEARAGGTTLAFAGLAAAFQALGLAIEPLLLTTGRARAALWSAAAGFAAFLGAAAALAGPLGLVGIGAALAAGRATQTLLRLGLVAGFLRSVTEEPR